MYKKLQILLLFIAVSIVALLMNSCAKDSININMEFPLDNGSNNSGSNNNSNTKPNDGDSTKIKSTIYYNADIIGIAINQENKQQIEAGREAIINAYDGSTLVSSKVYKSTTGALTPTDDVQMTLPTGTYALYSAGVNTENVTVPTFNSDGLATSLQNQYDYIWWSESGFVPTYPSSVIQIDYKHCCIQVVVFVSGEGVTINNISDMKITTSTTNNISWNLFTGAIGPSQSISTSYTAMGIASIKSGYAGQIIMLPLKMSGNLGIQFNAQLDDNNINRAYEANLPIYNNDMIAGRSYHYFLNLVGTVVTVGNVYVDNWVPVTANNSPIIPSEI